MQVRAIRSWGVRNLIRYGGWRILTKLTQQDFCYNWATHTGLVKTGPRLRPVKKRAPKEPH